jgi:hypothetical protein
MQILMSDVNWAPWGMDNKHGVRHKGLTGWHDTASLNTSTTITKLHTPDGSHCILDVELMSAEVGGD